MATFQVSLNLALISSSIWVFVHFSGRNSHFQIGVNPSNIFLCIFPSYVFCLYLSRQVPSIIRMDDVLGDFGLAEHGPAQGVRVAFLGTLPSAPLPMSQPRPSARHMLGTPQGLAAAGE